MVKIPNKARGRKYDRPGKREGPQKCLRRRVGPHFGPHSRAIFCVSMPFPERPPRMHQRTYERLSRKGMNLESGLSKRMRRRFPDYASLVAYSD
jgi:hypothetical protein